MSQMRLPTSQQTLRLPLTAPDTALRFLALLVSVCGVLAAVGLLTSMPFGRAVWDYVFLLDGAYRISLGQTPHVDFTSPIGPLSLYFTYAAETLFPGKHPFVGLHAVAWIVIAPLFALLAPRFRSIWAFSAALCLLLLITLLPMTVEQTHLSEISYFAVYNRFATGLLFIAGLWLVLPRRRYDWVLLALLLTLLFFLKITAWAVGLGILMAAAILGRLRLQQLALALVCFGVGLAAVQVSTGLVAAYLHDIVDMSAVNRGSSVSAIFIVAARNWAPLAALVGLLAVLASRIRPGRLSWRQPVSAVRNLAAEMPFAMDAALLVIAALLAESQNTGGLGLIAAAALFFHDETWRGTPLRTAISAILLATLLLPVLDTAVDRSLKMVRREANATIDHPVTTLLPGTRVPLPTAQGERLLQRIREEWRDFASAIQDEGFFIDQDPTSNHVAVQLAWATSAVEAGRRFVELGYGSSTDRYATLAFADPFARMLGLASATGTNIVLEPGRTVPDFSFELADSYLAAATGVFVDTCTLGEVTVAQPFGAILDQQFELLPLTRCWDYFRRLTPSTSAQE